MKFPVSDFFGTFTFGHKDLKARLTAPVLRDLEKSLEGKKKISRESLDEIAQIIKEWALSQGATHFCHWFQPLNGQTAEKHDSFIELQSFEDDGTSVIERFTGRQLVRGEPDASSFPSGGLRSTFEARGYTTWDHTSPFFILKNSESKILCIPSHFISYNGQALDNKTPLVRSLKLLNENACKFLKVLGDVDVKRASATLGIEQEYFLVDKQLASRRPDLLICEKTLFGKKPFSGIKVEDNYFGSISARVMKFLEAVEHNLYQLGVPVKTRHNEVAPNQFEMAPLFESANISSDHNCLTMEVLTKTALEHDFICLLHEKPFEGVAGSGKHCNWSLVNEKGENLLEPGRTPHQNLRFLALLVCVLEAVRKNYLILSAFAANHGNDSRMGKLEAPCRVFSMYLGEILEEILENIDDRFATSSSKPKNMSLGFVQLGQLALDYSDRNRTSTFAFTGNKFEFRALGASSNVALPIAALNASVASALEDGAERLSKLLEKGLKKELAVRKFIKQTFADNRSILFCGNSYSEEWQLEAKERGIESFEDAIDLYYKMDKKNCDFMLETGVLTNEELEARKMMLVDHYLKRELMETQVLIDLTKKFALPALEKQLIQTGKVVELLNGKESFQKRVSQISAIYAKGIKALEGIEQLPVNMMPGEFNLDYEKAKSDLTHLRKVKEKLKETLNSAEREIAKDYWILPTTDDLLSGFKH